jgi:hypothetical protein
MNSDEVVLTKGGSRWIEMKQRHREGGVDSNAEFEGWDTMLELVKQRKEDRAEQSRSQYQGRRTLRGYESSSTRREGGQTVIKRDALAFLDEQEGWFSIYMRNTYLLVAVIGISAERVKVCVLCQDTRGKRSLLVRK